MNNNGIKLLILRIYISVLCDLKSLHSSFIVRKKYHIWCVLDQPEKHHVETSSNLLLSCGGWEFPTFIFFNLQAFLERVCTFSFTLLSLMDIKSTSSFQNYKLGATRENILLMFPKAKYIGAGKFQTSICIMVSKDLQNVENIIHAEL